MHATIDDIAAAADAFSADAITLPLLFDFSASLFFAIDAFAIISLSLILRCHCLRRHALTRFD